MELPSWTTLKAKTQLEALETLPTISVAQTRRSDAMELTLIRRLELQMLTEVNSIKNSQLKKGKITKNTFDHIGDHINHSKNIN
uniref:Uncharacterized protein n=1 Tax=Solanum tuberosum TaxID=4113 RepID=M1BM40_SOLTU